MYFWRWVNHVDVLLCSLGRRVGCRGHIFSCVQPFYERAVSDLKRSLQRSLWVWVTHSSFLEGSHMTKIQPLVSAGLAQSSQTVISLLKNPCLAKTAGIIDPKVPVIKKWKRTCTLWVVVKLQKYIMSLSASLSLPDFQQKVCVFNSLQWKNIYSFHQTHSENLNFVKHWHYLSTNMF
jgi:hypothetical protein